VLGTNRPGTKSLGDESSWDEKVLGTSRPHLVTLFVPGDEMLWTKSPDTSKTGGGGKPPQLPYRRTATAQSDTPVTKWRTVSSVTDLASARLNRKELQIIYYLL